MTYQDRMWSNYQVLFCNPEQALLAAVIQSSMIGKLWEAINEQIEATQDLEHITNMIRLQRPETLPKCKLQEVNTVLYLEYLWKTAEINLVQGNTTSSIRIYVGTQLLKE